MTNSGLKRLLQVQLLDTQRLLQQIGEHPFMSISLRQKEQELIKKIDAISDDNTEAKTVLLFSGTPVKGSIGIDAAFIGKIVPPYQKMVTSSFIHKNAKELRGKSREQKQRFTKLFITSLPRGSFGVELQKLEHDGLFDEAMLSETLDEVAHIIKASSDNDMEFEEVLEQASIKTLKGLKEFLNIVSTEHANVTIDSANEHFELSNAKAREAFERVNSTATEEDEIVIEGMLRGVLLDSWRFDFQPLDGKRISGRISEDAEEPALQYYLKNYLDKNVNATFEQSVVVFKDGKPRRHFKLKSIIENPDNI